MSGVTHVSFSRELQMKHKDSGPQDCSCALLLLHRTSSTLAYRSPKDPSADMACQFNHHPLRTAQRERAE